MQETDLNGDDSLSREQKARKQVRQAAGFSVHLFTASGGAVAVLALYAAIDQKFATMFGWLALALFIDGIDGTLARAAKVTETAPVIDGAILDLVVDFLTYVLVPVVAIWRSDLMPEVWSFWIGLIVTIASAMYFADTRMKTKDNWFRGFPEIWNVFVLYLFVFRFPPVANAVLVLLFTGLMFAPVVFVHPLRVVKFRNLTIAMTILWFACAGYIVADHLEGGWVARVGLMAVALYVLALPLLRQSPWAEDD